MGKEEEKYAQKIEREQCDKKKENKAGARPKIANKYAIQKKKNPKKQPVTDKRNVEWLDRQIDTSHGPQTNQ